MEKGPLDAPTDVTVLLAEIAKGNQEAASRLIPLVYDEMRRVANRQMRRERPDHTLQATAVVHEAYLKLVEQHTDWQSRAHFFAVAARVMRHILIDHARGHLRTKRGGDKVVVPLDEALVLTPEKSAEVLAVDEALQRLARLDERQSKIVEMRFFGGLSVEEIAEVLDISSITVKRDWAAAKAWLYGELRR